MWGSKVACSLWESNAWDLILHYGELYNYFIIYHNVIIEIKCTISIMCLNHPKSITPPLVPGKIILNETDPRYKKVGDQWYIVQFSHSVTSNALQPHDCSMPGFPDHHQFLELAQTHVHQVGDDIQQSHSLASPSPPAFNLPPHQNLFHIRWPKYWSFSFSISPSSEYSGLISFRMDWLDLLAVQGTLKNLPQHYSWKASICRCSALWCNSHIHTWLLEKP